MNRKIDKTTLKRLFSYLKPYWFLLFLVALCIIVNAFASVRSSLFLQDLIDRYILPLVGESAPDYAPLFKALTIMASIYGVGIIGGFLQQFIMQTISQRVLKDIRDRMFTHMQDLPIGYFDTHSHGEVMSLYTNDTDTLDNMLSQSLPQGFSSLLTIIMVFVSMLSVSITLTVAVLVCVFIILKLIGKVTGRSASYFLAQQDSLAKLNGYVEEMVNGQKVIKVFNHEDKAIEDFKSRNETWRINAGLANGHANSVYPMMFALGYVQYIILAIIGGYMSVHGITNLSLAGAGILTLGNLVSFLTLSRNFVNPISQIAAQLNSIVLALAGASRIFAFLDEEPEVDNGYISLVNAYEDEQGFMHECAEHTGLWAWKWNVNEDEATEDDLLVKQQGMISIDHVDFSYVEGRQVLSDIFIYAEPGQKIAFVGATGAGKTTIANLINRFYDVDDGLIRYDGININNIKKKDLRNAIGVVLQDVNLFTGTVMENIRYGNPQATDQQCIAAAKLANADGFIRMLPQGYDTVLKGDGSGLSQGQRQLLSIARAAVSDPPVMILDEATSSIDTHTEKLVQDGMDKLMAGRTVFVIAHRLSTVQNSDVIMVLDHGKIIERGSHESLIEKKGVYYQLYTGAFELE
ncbi:MAG: ABC transporter ATP-binding protein [Erysipelotrichaceae bacterium]|nr:ABC transporter ATP-binding protein [Erysipelotrichaceae bacterium]